MAYQCMHLNPINAASLPTHPISKFCKGYLINFLKTLSNSLVKSVLYGTESELHVIYFNFLVIGIFVVFLIRLSRIDVQITSTR